MLSAAITTLRRRRCASPANCLPATASPAWRGDCRFRKPPRARIASASFRKPASAGRPSSFASSWNGATAQWNSPLACLRVRERPRNDRATTSSPKGDPAGDEVRVLLRRERPSWEVASFYGTHSRKAEKARLIQGGPATLGRYSSCWPPRKIESTVIAILRAGHPVELDAGPAK